VPLNHLVGHYFRLGACVLYGGRLNVPCRYLEDLLGKKVFKPLLNRSGLNCRGIIGGAIRKGDGVEWCDPKSLDPARRPFNELQSVHRPPDLARCLMSSNATGTRRV
jgi:MOSC domain-containing protein YiiM